jgi:hypothetical protein
MKASCAYLLLVVLGLINKNAAIELVKNDPATAVSDDTCPGIFYIKCEVRTIVGHPHERLCTIRNKEGQEGGEG